MWLHPWRLFFRRQIPSRMDHGTARLIILLRHLPICRLTSLFRRFMWPHYYYIGGHLEFFFVALLRRLLLFWWAIRYLGLRWPVLRVLLLEWALRTDQALRLVFVNDTLGPQRGPDLMQVLPINAIEEAMLLKRLEITCWPWEPCSQSLLGVFLKELGY